MKSRNFNNVYFFIYAPLLLLLQLRHRPQLQPHHRHFCPSHRRLLSSGPPFYPPHVAMLWISFSHLCLKRIIQKREIEFHRTALPESAFTYFSVSWFFFIASRIFCRSLRAAFCLSLSLLNLLHKNLTSFTKRRANRSAFFSSSSSSSPSDGSNSGSGELSCGTASLWRRDCATVVPYWNRIE